MINDLPKRLIEVDLPIKRISEHARREKSIRHGHISTLHIWWAGGRLPLAVPSFALLFGPTLLTRTARTAFGKWLAKRWVRGPITMSGCRARSVRSVFWRCEETPDKLNDNEELRKALLDFIADFANWDNSTVPEYLETSRALTQAAHEALGGAPGTRPLVVDPFAGGGSIPLEALRVGADAFASDLNPVPVLLNKVVLEYIPKYGQRLSRAS